MFCADVIGDHLLHSRVTQPTHTSTGSFCLDVLNCDVQKVKTVKEQKVAEHKNNSKNCHTTLTSSYNVKVTVLTTWLGFGKDHVLDQNTWCCCHKHGWKKRPNGR